MPRQKKYNSNAEKQKAYRERKKAEKSNANITKGNIVTATPDSVKENPGLLNEIKNMYENKIYTSDYLGPSKSFNNAIDKIRLLKNLEATGTIAKIDSGTTNNTGYIYRVLHDFYRSLEQINYL